ncbi:MAG: hypothetical protein ACK4N5_11560, partial [Myxococcales bacterium]
CAGGKGCASKASGGTFGKVDKTEKLVGASGAAGSSEVGGASGDVVVQHAAAVARALKSGEISTRQEAARKLVAGILKEKLKMNSKALESKIAEQIEDDPHLSATLDRILQRGG